MSTSFLSFEQIARTVPSALAESHDGHRSERYSFIPTRTIIEAMDAKGWGVVEAKVPKARVQRSRDFGLHQLVFQARIQTAIQDPRSGLIYPRLHIINSHNGTSPISVFAGLYALICTNGLIISRGSVGEFRQRHTKFSIEDAQSHIAQLTDSMEGMSEKVTAWGQLPLNVAQRNEFAIKAARIRWNKPEDIIPDPVHILQPVRTADSGNDLWTTFNVAQENILRGGYDRSKRKTRTVNNIRENLRINQELWALAEATFTEYSVN